jgi:Rrf2 family protein
MYGKQTRTAIAIMSLLAEAHGDGTSLSASRIAEIRGLSRPTVSKVLSILSTAGLVTGKSGPGGGFLLSRPPADITLFQVFSLFERQDEVEDSCPFGSGICGDDPCPLHERLEDVRRATRRLLHETTFGIFQKKRPSD